MRNSFDVNFDTLTIDEASLPNSIQGVAEGFGPRLNGTKLGMTFNKGYAGLTEFQYKVKDSQGALSEFNTASILVKTTNVAPFINDAEIFIEEFSTNTIELFNIMGMSDFEGSNLEIINISALPGNNGSTISLNNNTTIDVDASGVANGTGSRFNITINDGSNATRTAILTVTTVAEPCPLVSVAGVDLGTILNNGSVNLQQLLLNSASNGASVNNYTFEVFSIDNNGIGQLRGTVFSGIGDLGTIDLSYRIKNSCGSVSTIGNVTGTLIADNVAPIANDFTKKTDYNTPITIDLTAYGSDEDGDTLSVHSVEQFNYLNLSGNNLTVTPGSSNKTEHTLTFNYRLSDGQALSNLAKGSVKVGEFVPPKPTFSISSNDITEGRSVRMTVTLLGANVGGKEFAIQFKEYYNGALHNTSLSKRSTTPASASDGDTISFDYKTAFERELHTSRTVTARVVANSSDFSNHDQSSTVTIANESATYGNTFKKLIVDEGSTTPAVSVYASNVSEAERNGWTWSYPTLTGDLTGSFNLVWDTQTKYYRQDITIDVPAYPNNYEDQVAEVSVFKPNGSLYGKFTVIGTNTDIALTVPAINSVDKFDTWTEDSVINTLGVFSRATLQLALDGTYNDGTFIGGTFTAKTWASNPPFDSGWRIQTRNVGLDYSGDTNPPIFHTNGLTFRISADYEKQPRTHRQNERDRENMIGAPINFMVNAAGEYRVIWSEDTSKVSNWSTFRVGLQTYAYDVPPGSPPTTPPDDPPPYVPPPSERVILDSVCERPDGVNTGYRIDIYNTEPFQVKVYDVSTCPLPVEPPPPPTVIKAYCEQDTNGNTGVLITEMSDGTVNRNTNTIVCPLPVAPPVTVTSAYCEKNSNGENTGKFTTEFSDGTSVTITNVTACPLPATPPSDPTVVREYCELITLARGRIRRTGTLVQVLSNGTTREVQDSVTCPPGLVGGGPGGITPSPIQDPPTSTGPVVGSGIIVDDGAEFFEQSVDTTPNAEVTVRDNVATGNQNRYTNGLNFRGGGPDR